MASSKAALKKAKAAIDEQRWEEVVSQVETVLAADSQNYFAYASDALGQSLVSQRWLIIVAPGQEAIPWSCSR